MNMENLSFKNILWIFFGIACGYFAGQGIGMLLGITVGIIISILFGGLAYQATNTIIVNTMLSVTLGLLLSYLAWSFDKRLFGSKMSFQIWGLAGAIAGLVVMLTYGINVISHPEVYGNFNGLNPIYEDIFDINRNFEAQPPWYLSPLHFGGGTGQLAGTYLGVLAGLLISIRETIGRKRTAQDKKEFDEYSNFFKERLKQ